MLRFLPRPLLLLTLLLLTATQPLCAQAPAWQDATSPGGGIGYKTAVDAAGNVYVTGTFTGTATFGATTLTGAGFRNLFVAKLASDGTYQWAVGVGAGYYVEGFSIAVDAGSNVIVTGYFQGPTINFGATTLRNNDYTNMFVASLTSNGAWRWAVSADANSNTEGLGVACDGSGNVLVTGFFSGVTATFGSTTLTNTAASGADLFVAKLSSAGSWLWVASAAGGGNDYPYGIAASAGGEVCITGTFNSYQAVFGTTTISTVSGYDMFVAKLTSAGTWLWATSTGGSSNDGGAGVAIDDSESIVVSGAFSSSTIPFGTTTLANAGTAGGDIYVAKLTPGGAWQWAISAGDRGDDNGFSVAVDATNSVLVTGNFFGSPIFGTTTLTSIGGYDVFVAKLTPTGAWQWACQAGSTGSDTGAGISLAGNGGAILTGYFGAATAAFGATTLISTNLSSSAIFIAHLGAQPSALASEQATSTFTLWPNPAHGTVRLSGAAPGPVQLLDALGRVVRTSPLAPGTSNLDLSGLPPGLYTVRAGTQARRLVVE